MAKTAISLTINEKLVKQLRQLAQADNRTLSNYTENIIRAYLESIEEKDSVIHSYENAKKIEADMQIMPFSETYKVLMQNVHLKNEDKEFLSKLKEE